MELFPELKLGWLNGWLPLAAFYGMFILLLVAFPSDMVKRLYGRPRLSRKQFIVTRIGQLVAVVNIILMIFMPLKIGTAVFAAGGILYVIGAAGFFAALFNYRDTPLDRPVTKGLYRASRNPQWIMAATLMMGVAIAVGSRLAVLMLAVLFLAAGRWDIPQFWAYLACWTICVLVASSYVRVDLMRERIKPGPGGRDYAMRFGALPVMLSHYILAGLDVGRYHWSDTVPVGLQGVGLACIALAFALIGWAYYVNPFFSSVIRLQTDRGHYLVTAGPYRYIRHPGYAGVTLIALASGLALNSWVVYLPMLLGIGLVLRRTVLEDRFLHENLAGYVDYVRQVPYRLIPGVW